MARDILNARSQLGGQIRMIDVKGVTKSFGPTRAVESVSFVAPSGAITGFLGPNGAGKTTTLRILLGLARPDAGTALIDATRYRDLSSPRRKVGAVLDLTGFHPGRTARNHLRIVARAAGISPSRVDDVFELVELTEAADRRVEGFSHGMRQRLALAGALLGDPEVLVLDEPGTGLDPAGIAWLRRLLVAWAGQGRTVLFSSHVLAEVEAVARRVVIIDRGHIVHEGPTAELSGAEPRVIVRAADAAKLGRLAELEGWRVRRDGADSLVVQGVTAAAVGGLAAREGIVLTELSTKTSTRQLEQMFLELTGTGGEARS
jgi:ABC-2 type transport system ATP-binding protein